MVLDHSTNRSLLTLIFSFLPILTLFSNEIKLFKGESEKDTIVKTKTYYSSVDKDSILSKKYFVDSSIVLEKNYYSNGNIQSRRPYNSEGNPHGIIKTWYKNGQLRSELNKDNDTVSGKLKNYYKSGEIKVSGHIVDNRGIVTEYYKTGEKQAEYVLSGKRAFVGPYVGYYKDGSVRHVTNYGTKKSARKYIDFYKNGNKKKEAYLINGTDPHKKWKFFNKKGKLNKIKIYDKGELLKEKDVDPEK